LRTFVSVPIPREIRENTLREAKSLLEDTRIRWSKPENLHLTLKFLGEVPETSLPSIKEELARISLIHSTFEISISGLGAFPSEGRARVVWAGVEEGADSLSLLAGDVEASLEALGFEKEQRPFHPHVTLGRCGKKPLWLNLEGLNPVLRGFSADRIELMQSTLTDKGATYSLLASFLLEGEQRPHVHENEE
jgi:2'-5' RNA ligase